MKRSFLTILLLLFFTPLLLFAQQVWEGSSAVGNYGSFPSTGLYGASDSFAQNTLVTVTNPATNKKTTVLIIDRLNNSGLFMLLSKDAGAAIGLSSGQVSQVRVSLAKQPSPASRGPGDLPYSTDPDLFPAAGVGNPSSLSFLDQYLKSTQPSTGQSSAAAPATPAPTTSSQSAGAQSATSAAAQTAKQQSTPEQTSTQPAAGSTAPASGTPAPAETQSPPQPQVASTPVTKSVSPPTAAQVPSSTGVKAPQEPTGGGAASPGARPAAPSAPSSPSVPSTTGLASVRPASVPQPVFSVADAPQVPPVSGAAPTVSSLAAAATPPQPESQSPVLELPRVRAPGPRLTGIESGRPPSGAPVRSVEDLPVVPSGGPSGPQLSELSPASPPPIARQPALTEAVPSIQQPGPAQAATGPTVSLLAQAQPPEVGTAVAEAELPLPATSRVTPATSSLAASSPPPATPEQVAIVPAAPTPAATGPGQPQKAAPRATPPSTAATTPAAGRVPLRSASDLVAASYYLQLGAYRDSQGAMALADNLSPDYPVSVYRFTTAERPLYKVMIGPLNLDESGTLLYLFESQGYAGAFVRRGQ